MLNLPTAPAYGQTAPTITAPEDITIAATSVDGILLSQDSINSSSFTFGDGTSFMLTVTNLQNFNLICQLEVGGLNINKDTRVTVGTHTINCVIGFFPDIPSDTFTITVTPFGEPTPNNRPDVVAPTPQPATSKREINRAILSGAGAGHVDSVHEAIRERILERLQNNWQ